MNIKKLTTYSRTHEKVLESLFYFFTFAAIAVFALLQPFGEPPDEINRYKVAQYICIHGKLPVGADPEVLIGGYGASYAFQPILSYIIMGWVMRFFFQFTYNSYLLAYSARFVNVIIGVCMAFFVRKISKEVFDKPSMQWLFSLLVVFLPQNLFLHSYVNTDSMAALATAIIIYACIRGCKDCWSTRTCITLSLGIILCALSYYNAYSIILCSILLFFFCFIKKESRGNAKAHYSLQWKPLLQKGFFISVIVLIGIGWWFIRNAVLYDGDFIGMTARMKCAVETSIPSYSPDVKETLQSTGHSLAYLFRETLFLHTLYESFIATFGTMNVFTYPFIYTAYRVVFVGCLLCLSIPAKQTGTTYLKNFSKSTKTFFNLLMLLDMIIVASLCVWYSYSWDYQPQGRYVLPLLIPLMYFLSIGIAKLDGFLCLHVVNGRTISYIIQTILITFVILALAATMLGAVIPYYQSVPNWLNGAIESLT
ncbi:MAG: hypothetical protein PHS74_08105 [Lachnospiraceae bacterium]|nr:hypothetical protein [Lachnospiraceae bacterium]